MRLSWQACDCRLRIFFPAYVIFASRAPFYAMPQMRTNRPDKVHIDRFHSFAEDIVANIIAGQFTLQDQVQQAVEELTRAGFAAEHISAFYSSAPGRHAEHPVGGDRNTSPGAEHSGKGMAAGAASGAAVGTAAGAATAPVTGPVGPIVGGLLGAHVGSFVGSLSQMDEAEETPPVRRAGMMVAVEVMGNENEARAIDVLRRLGATAIERANGTIENGDWRDFNPLSTPALVDRPVRRTTG
jgi:hypothetical protein